MTGAGPHATGAGIAAAGWGLVTFLTDLLPPRIRYGYVHRATRAVLERTLPAVPASGGQAKAPPENPTAAVPIRTRCVLTADTLDIGGIGTVIEMLATSLRAHAVEPVVMCRSDGSRAERLRAAGIEVVAVSDEAAALAAITRLAPHVIESHSAPPVLEQAALRSGLPLIPVMHNTEIHYTAERWEAFRTLLAGSVAGVAVSATVRAFHERHVGTATPITVIGNGAPVAACPSAEARGSARAVVGTAIGADLRDDVVFVCLARYDAQKNIPGLVSAFSTAAARDPAVRLICAGDPSDWVDLRRADAIRRAGAAASRIHLLGNSDARTLLTAADAFVLDSFFEGWPVAATEAAAFGHPLVLSDVGGARELVARDPERSVLIPNATGPADLVSDRRVRAARRRSRRQGTAADLADAVHRVAQAVRAERAASVERVPDAARSSVEHMLAQHAALLHGVAHGHGR